MRTAPKPLSSHATSLFHDRPSPVIVFHIRAPKPARGTGNAFYQAAEPRYDKTLCGAPVTSHDNSFAWEPHPAGDYAPCSKCCEIRIAARGRRRG